MAAILTNGVLTIRTAPVFQPKAGSLTKNSASPLVLTEEFAQHRQAGRPDNAPVAKEVFVLAQPARRCADERLLHGRLACRTPREHLSARPLTV